MKAKTTKLPIKNTMILRQVLVTLERALQTYQRGFTMAFAL